MSRGSIAVALVLAGSASGCAAFNVLTNKADKYEVESIELSFEHDRPTFCPGQSTAFTVFANAHKKRDPGEMVRLQATLDGEEDLDLVEFAMAARGGEVARGRFTAASDPFDALLGFDVRATYRRDPTKEVVVHFDPTYDCIQSVGRDGQSGAQGQPGVGATSEGGAGGGGGPGGRGDDGPSVTAFVTLVRTPKYERMGLAKIDGGHMVLFDPAEGITVHARGGRGGSGGPGGEGGQGTDPQGPGGPGGAGGTGGPGGNGGTVLVVVDDRYPALAKVVGYDVSGGAPGRGGDGGYGGLGGPAPDPACDSCEQPPEGPDGAAGAPGHDGTVGGRDGVGEIRMGDPTAAFTDLPRGIRLRDDPRPEPQPVAAPPPPQEHRKKKKRRGRRRR